MGDTLLGGDFVSHPHHFSHNPFFLYRHRGRAAEMLFGNNQEMDRSLRADIAKGENLIVLIELGGRNFTTDDFAEETVVRHEASSLVIGEMGLRLSGVADLGEQMENQRVVRADNLDPAGGRIGVIMQELQGVQIDRVFLAAQSPEQGGERSLLAVIAGAGVRKPGGDKKFPLGRVETGVQVAGHGEMHLANSELDILTSNIGHHH